MSLQLKDVEFNIGTGAAASTVDVTGFGFQPKAVLLFAIGRSEATDAGGAGDNHRLVGFAAQTTEGGGTKQAAVSSRSEHGVAAGSQDSAHYLSAASCVLAMNLATPTPEGEAQITSWLADGFRLTIVNQFSVNQRVLALGIGGSDLLNIEAGAFSAPTTGTTPFDQDITTGFTCQNGEGLLFLLAPKSDTDNGGQADGSCGFGMATGAGVQGSWAGQNNDVNPTTTLCVRHLSDQLCYATFNSATSSLTRRAAFGGWITNGFRLSWQGINSVDSRIHWLVIKGGKWKVVHGDTAASLTTVPITGVGFAPIGGLVVSHHSVRQGTGVNAYASHDPCSFGIFTSPSSRRCVAQIDVHGVGTSAVATRIEHDAVYAQTDEAGAAVGLMDVQSMDSDGVTFVMDDADPSSVAFAALLAGSGSVAGGTGGGRVSRARRRR